MIKQSIFLLISSFIFASAGLAFSNQDAQQCILKAQGLAQKSIERSIEDHLYINEVVADARRDWSLLSRDQRKTISTAARTKMVNELRPFRLFLGTPVISVSNTKYLGGSLYQADGFITILFWSKRQFYAVIDTGCRIRQVTVYTNKNIWRNLSEWLAEEMKWPP